jgi:hypothetical protein
MKYDDFYDVLLNVRLFRPFAIRRTSIYVYAGGSLFISPRDAIYRRAII